MAIAEKVAQKAGFSIVHAIMRTISVVSVLAVVGIIIWSCYVTFVKPHTNPTKTQSQQAEQIINKEEIHHHGIFHFKFFGLEFGF